MKLHREKSVCKICGKPAKGHGYCEMHYQRWKKYGNPLYYQGQIVGIDFNERADQEKVVGIIQLTKEGVVVAEYPTIKEASEKTEVNASSICNVIAGRRLTAGNYKWVRHYRE